MSSGIRCGEWPSPLSPQAAAAGAVSLSFAGAADGTLFWIEGRPAERGRSVLMARRPDGRVEDVVPPEANVRTRVHEYGGTPWTAVGSRLVWPQFDDQRLRVQQRDGSVSLLTPPGCRYADGRAVPGGRFMVAVREDHRAAGEAVNTVVLLDLDAAGPGTHEGEVLYSGSDFVAWPRPSNDGQRLAWVAWDHPDMPWDATRLMVGDLRGGTLANARLVAGGTGESVLDPQWDAQGRLYFISDRTGWWNLYRWTDDGAGGRVEPMTELAAEVGGPLWQLGASWFALAPTHAVLVCSKGAVDSLAVLDLRSRELRTLDLPFVLLDTPVLLDEHTVCIIAARADAPAALVSIDLRSGANELIRSAGDAPIAPEYVSRPQAIEFPTQPGPSGEARTAHAWFFPPHLPGVEPAPGELPALIVFMHGGPTSNVSPAFKVSAQFWTTRGFAVLDVNYGGSTGYGREYRERLRGQWGVVDLQDAVAGVEYLAATGRIDARRVAIRGGSAGGYTVLSALAFSDRFSAGINYFGVADLETLATDTHKFESRYLDSLIAPLPQGREVYRARSPVHHMAGCKAALITFQGTDDKAVPPQQSRSVVAAARAAGCPVAYVEFEGEGHGFRDAANLVRAMQCELVFLGRVFGFIPPGEMPPLHIDNERAP